jgi:hypothetical protein
MGRTSSNVPALISLTKTRRTYSGIWTRSACELNEDEAGRAGREDMAVRLSKCGFVKVHAFKEEDQQPEHLSAEDVAGLFA